ncbi:Ytp1p SCDLUD_003038 [Saccharomycodes ludwigii]|uniref:Ytp1p n=1 Tax=Saccharomycodes ludwigii TaxID=36035 RepID=UPI001E848DC8|nr:hypothetical protein SCDLUD_003038 [Saccharomycodes ludwigii]KAH3901541.1 hypothetical protein SCDLUD_003038 [Saccharomycodes ludwigii]
MFKCRQKTTPQLLPSVLLIMSILLSKVRGHEMAGMDDTDDLTFPDIVDFGPKMTHWLLSVFFLLLLSSFSTSLAFSSKTHASVLVQTIITIYAFFEKFLLRFPDNDGIENRVSRCFGWIFLSISITTLFFGSLASGTGLLSKYKKINSLSSKLGTKVLVYIHRALSLVLIWIGWIKVCLAPVALFGFCRGGSTGQCIAHGIMGTSFVIYGFVYSMVLVVPWIRLANYSQDHVDSWIIMIWGCVNTFTEGPHGDSNWSHGDFQHTSMGIIWWCAGLLGVFLSRNKQRTFVPSLVFIFTGWAMMEHVQLLIISTKVHYLFGLVLVSGGVCRIIEISFLFKDRLHLDKIYSFQYLPPFTLVCSGILFMGANEEQLNLVLRIGADHSAYSLVLLAASFLVYFWIICCLNIYVRFVEREKAGFLDSYESNLVRENSENFELSEGELDDLNDNIDDHEEDISV